MAKYLDQAGLNYLWQKIRLAFADINHNHDDKYLGGNLPIGSTGELAARGHVANWKDGNTLEPGHRLMRDVLSTNKFVDEVTFKLNDTTIEPVNNVYTIPLAAKNVVGVVTTDSTVSSVSGQMGTTSVTGYRSTPIINGIPYYVHYVHPAYTVTGTTSEQNMTADGSFDVIDSVNVDGTGHVTSINTKTIHVPGMVTTGGNLPAGKIILGAGGKGITGSSYTLGSNTIGATASRSTTLATEAAVAHALSQLPIQGATGPILKVENQVLGTTLGIKIVSGGATSGSTDRSYIQLTGINDQVIASVDASQFVIDGMISNVYWSTDPGERYVLVIEWNTDSGTQKTKIDFANFIDQYFAGDGIQISTTGATGGTGNISTISIKLDNTTQPTSPKTKVNLYTGPSGLRADIDLTGKVDKVTGASVGNIAVYGASGVLVDSGKKPGDYVEKSTVVIPATPTQLVSGATASLGSIDGKSIQVKMPDLEGTYVRRDAVDLGATGAVVLQYGATSEIGSVDGHKITLVMPEGDTYLNATDIENAITAAEAVPVASRPQWPS